MAGKREKIGRNAPCPCGSGLKYKRCCLAKQEGEPARALANEQLDECMQEGYQLSAARQGARACDLWLELWRSVRSRLRPEMRTCRDADAVFPDSQMFLNWVQDFSDELHNAALDRPRYADAGSQLCEHVLAQFVDEDDLFTSNFRAALGEFRYLAGRHVEGERVLLDLIRDRPNTALGYVHLADMLARGEKPLDPRRAERLLQQALPLPDAADFDVEARLDYLTKNRPS